MLNLLFVLMIGLVAASVGAAPYLVCDPPLSGEDVQWYVVTGLPASIDASKVPVDSTGKYGFKLDLGSIEPGGPYTVKAKACRADETWGELCSADSLPFEFVRPSLLVPPVDLRLSK